MPDDCVAEASPPQQTGGSSGDEEEQNPSSASSDEEGSSSASDSEESTAESSPSCPDCGKPFVKEGGVLKCKCGMQRAAPAVTPVRTAQGRSRAGSGKKKAKTPPKITKSQKFLAEVSGRLNTGVPNFVLKDAHQLYNRALKSDDRKGCSDVGEALLWRPRHPLALTLVGRVTCRAGARGARARAAQVQARASAR